MVIYLDAKNLFYLNDGFLCTLMYVDSIKDFAFIGDLKPIGKAIYFKENKRSHSRSRSGENP